MNGDVTKLSDLHAYLERFPTSQTTAIGIGCKYEVVVITRSISRDVHPGIPEPKERNFRTCESRDIVRTHYEQIIEEMNKREGFVMHVRTKPEIIDILDDEGEFTGQYHMRSRLQFGEPGKFITNEQYKNLVELGWNL